MMRMLILPFVLLPAGCAAQDRGQDPVDQALEAKTDVPVYLNHALGMHPQVTIDAIQNDKYLANQFSDVEVRTTVRPDITYTGTYLNGHVTYMELFVDGTLGIPHNVFEVALGTEVTGSAEVVQQKWNAELGENEKEIPTFFRTIDGVDIPWFRGVIPAWTKTAQSVGLFDVEYVPNPGSTVPRTRLEERAARYKPDLLMKDIQAYLFAAPAGEIDLLRRSLTSLGWSASTRDQGFVALSPLDHGTRRAIVVEQSLPAAAGMQGVVFSLNRVEQHEEPLGQAVLKVGILGQPYAVLWFSTPSPALESDLTAVLLP